MEQMVSEKKRSFVRAVTDIFKFFGKVTCGSPCIYNGCHVPEMESV
jgi:hypothetical protein